MPARVVVVRDDPIRDTIVDALRAAGINVAGFAKPGTALDSIAADSRCEVLVTKFDFGRGIQNGISLALMLKMRRRQLKVLFVGREEYRKLTEGVGEFLPVEPLDLTHIVQTVRRMLGSGGAAAA